MPVMDGYETMRAMRKLRVRRKDLPIIAVTAKAEAGERQRCIDAGASATCPSPSIPADLLRVLGEWLPAGPAREPPADLAQ